MSAGDSSCRFSERSSLPGTVLPPSTVGSPPRSLTLTAPSRSIQVMSPLSHFKLACPREPPVNSPRRAPAPRPPGGDFVDRRALCRRGDKNQGARGPKSGHHVYKANRRDWWFLCDWWLWDPGGTIGVLVLWGRGVAAQVAVRDRGAGDVWAAAGGDRARARRPTFCCAMMTSNQGTNRKACESGHFVHKVSDRGWL